MRVVLFGSYSIRRTTPVTPRISRWKSTIRYLRLWPPPRVPHRDAAAVVAPAALREALRQRLERLAFPQVVARGRDATALAGTRRFVHLRRERAAEEEEEEDRGLIKEDGRRRARRPPPAKPPDARWSNPKNDSRSCATKRSRASAEESTTRVSVPSSSSPPLSRSLGRAPSPRRSRAPDRANRARSPRNARQTPRSLRASGRRPRRRPHRTRRTTRRGSWRDAPGGCHRRRERRPRRSRRRDRLDAERGRGRGAMLPPDAQTQARSDRLGPRLRRSRARRRVRDARERPPEESHPEHARRRPIGAREVLAAGSAGRGDATAVGNSFRFHTYRRSSCGDGANRAHHVGTERSFR